MSSMRMSFRWFGKNHDTISLEYIRQIPGMQEVVTALFDIPVGEIWPMDPIIEVKTAIEAHGLRFETVESVNVHEDIKLGLASRDKYIENYMVTLRNLAKAGVKVVCYNFMPLFDFIRTDLAKVLPDQSTVMSYNHHVLQDIVPRTLVDHMKKGSNGFVLPGWEKEKLDDLSRLFVSYEGMDEETLFTNLRYFLEAIIPVAEECNIKMAIHPDDPPWPVFGLPRIVTNQKKLDRLIHLVDSPYNGLTLCSGALGENQENDIPSMIRHFGQLGRIHFGHVRNIKIHSQEFFDETSHKAADGSLDMYEIMRAYYDIGFDGPIRPDHGRMIWGEQGRPGYGLYDRALGAVYLHGLWDALNSSS